MGIKYICDRCGKEAYRQVLYSFVIYGEDTDLSKTKPIVTDKEVCEKCFNEVQKKIVKLLKEEIG